MKKVLGFALLLLLATFVSPAATPTSEASFTASVTCGFASSGRGACSAYPQGAGYSYSWWGSGGANASTRNAANVSATCSQGPFGEIHVTITGGGSSSSASTSAVCPAGGR